MELRALSEIIGNRRLIGLLKEGRLPQSSLFAGPEGVGKRSLALLLAAYRNCQNPDDEICGRCPSCLRVLAGTHPDVRVIGPDGVYIKIEQMRQMSQEIHYRPFEGKLRFFIIDSAEKMRLEAANSILKTLEEPPPTARIILISSTPERLLSTIRSRCQLFRFQAIPRQELDEALRKKPGIEDPGLVAAFAGGSMGRALQLADRERLDEIVKARDGLLELIDDWMQSRRFDSVFRYSERKSNQSLLKTRDGVRERLDQLQTICCDLYFLKVETPHRVVNIDRVEALEKLQKKCSVEDLRYLLKSISDARSDVDRNVNPLPCFQTLWLAADSEALS